MPTACVGCADLAPKARCRALPECRSAIDGATTGWIILAVLLLIPRSGSGGTPGGTGARTPRASVGAAVDKVDGARAKQPTLRRLTGKHLTLYTDLAADKQVDALPSVFDAATRQWCQYFGVPPSRAAAWRISACLMRDKRLFAARGLLPEDVPPFRHGYSRERELWLHEQPTAYYRRHLLLHEGTHSFMHTMLGGCGPPWYMEGIAELLATHTYRDGTLALGQFPASRDDVPMLGRIGLVQRCVAAERTATLASIFAYEGPEFLHNEPYAWAWTVAALLDGHPHYRDRFRAMHRYVTDPDFTERFRTRFAQDWLPLAEQWRLFVGSLEYGHDIARSAIDFTPGQPLADHGVTRTVAADRGWQNTRLQLAAGRTYRFAARGRYQVAARPKTWWCESGGVTIRYYRGRPLGILLGTLWAQDRPGTEPTPFLRPFAIGTGRPFVPKRSGTLYLAVNESPAALDDNAGTLQVVIAPHRAAN